jgi:hypothetical protein
MRKRTVDIVKAATDVLLVEVNRSEVLIRRLEETYAL